MYVSFLIRIQYKIIIAEIAELTIVASDAPAEPKPNVYMNIGSRLAFRMTVATTTYIARFMSPSPRRIPLHPFPNIKATRPKNSGVA